jgi:hypothetical protein
MHSASMIIKKKAAYLSLASAPVVLSWGKSRPHSSSVCIVVWFKLQTHVLSPVMTFGGDFHRH